MSEKTRKYILYAIGEIALVMIGILLALQVNTWNEKRLDKEYISVMFKEMYYDMSDDYRVIYIGVEPRIDRKIEGVVRVKEFMTSKTVPSDSVFMEYYGRTKIGFLLTTRTGGYESLKQRGLDKIKNDTLRTRIFEFYESDVPRFTAFLQEGNASRSEYVRSLESDLFEYRFIENDVGEYVQVEFPKNEDYLNHQSLHKIFKTIESDVFYKKYRIRSLKSIYQKMMQDLEEELNIRGVAYTRFDTTGLNRDF